MFQVREGFVVTIRIRSAIFAALAAAVLAPSTLHAQALPTYPTAATATTTEWGVDRYAPANFNNGGTVQGRENVLILGVNEADGPGNRPQAQSSTFFDTQGRKLQILDWSGPRQSFVGALFIPSEWGVSTGLIDSRRTDMWAVLTPSGVTSTSSALYAILGFSNEGPAPVGFVQPEELRDQPADFMPVGGGDGRYQLFDKDGGGFIPIGTPVRYDQWTDFCISYTGNTLEFYIGDDLVYTDNSIDVEVGGMLTTVDGFWEVIMQAKNYGERPTPPGGIAGVTYDTNWAGLALGSGTCDEVRENGGFSAELQLVKSVSPSLVSPGQQTVFTLTATNNGPDPATGTVVVDTLPPELVYVSNSCGAQFSGNQLTWLIGDFAVGATVSCQVTVQVTTTGTFTNGAVIDAEQVDPILVNNDDLESVSAGPPQAPPSAVPGLGTGPSWLLAMLVLLGAWWFTRQRSE